MRELKHGRVEHTAEDCGLEREDNDAIVYRPYYNNDWWMVHCDDEREDYDFLIKYCPFCGKKLEG